MRPNVYKHRDNTDVAMKVVKSYWIPEKNTWKVKALWLNIINPKNVFLILKEKVKNWEVCDV